MAVGGPEEVEWAAAGQLRGERAGKGEGKRGGSEGCAWACQREAILASEEAGEGAGNSITQSTFRQQGSGVENGVILDGLYIISDCA